jgi:hypothetical protein
LYLTRWLTTSFSATLDIRLSGLVSPQLFPGPF